MKLLVLALTGLLLPFTTSCAQLLFSPETAFDPHHVINCPENTTVGDIQILGSRQNQGNGIVLLEAVCYGQNPKDVNETLAVFSQAFLVRSNLHWQLKGHGSFTEKLQDRPSASECIEIMTGSTLTEASLQPVTTVYGRILSPNVTRVEVVLKDGRILQDENTHNIFGVFIPAKNFLSEVRALGHDNQVLRCDRPHFSKESTSN